MKINTLRISIVAFVIGVITMPIFVFALTIPSSGGQSTSGSTNNSSVPSSGGQNTTGATANSSVPSSGGQNTTGASANSTTPSASGQGTTGATSVPSNGGQGTTGAISIPSSGGQGTTGATAGNDPSVPNSGGQNTTGGTSVPSSGGQGTTGATSGDNNGGSDNGNGGNSGGGSSSGSSRRRTNTANVVNILPPLTNVSQCLYLNTYLKYGWNNPVSEVTKLQAFLKNIENINVNVTGIFDLQTLSAVHTFQAKYLEDVMVPWGVRHTSGFVYYTTTKKINEIFCKKNFALTPAQIAEIEAYRRNVGKQNTGTTVNNEVPVNVNPATGEPVVSTTTPDIGSNTNGGESQVASPEGVSFGGRIWNFVKWLFGVDSTSTSTPVTATSTQN